MIVDLPTVKRYLGLAPTDLTKDEFLTDLIGQVTQAVKSYLGRDVEVTDYVETLSGNNKDALMLINYPIISVSDVKLNDLSITAAANLTDDGYRFDSAMIILNKRIFSKGRLNVQVSYRAGFSTVPLDLVGACCKLVAHRFKAASTVGVSSKTLAGETVSYSQSSASLGKSNIDDGFPPDVLSILSNYQRVIP